MLRDNLGQIYKKVAILQALVTLILAVIAAVSGGAVAAGSVVAGGVVVLCGTASYAALAVESALRSVSAGKVLGRHLAAELVKVLTIAVLAATALASGWFAAGWLLAAMGVVLLGHWLALLIIK